MHIMMVGIWFVIIISIVVMSGEIKYLFFDKKESIRENMAVSRDWKDNIDTDVGMLSIEYLEDGVIPSQTLTMRSSWRLAQSQTMGEETFSKLREQEYAKML